jgi:hypothetical protein
MPVKEIPGCSAKGVWTRRGRVGWTERDLVAKSTNELVTQAKVLRVSASLSTVTVLLPRGSFRLMAGKAVVV